MKICIIGPGTMPIPPSGWGAIESLIWDYNIILLKNNHDVKIVNTPNPKDIVEETNKFKPDFVHVQYDDHAWLLQYIECAHKAATNHYGYLNQFENHPEYYHILNHFINGNFNIFCLSKHIYNTYLKLGIDKKRLFITPNGARNDLFNFNKEIAEKDKSIYLAKIDHRKRQYLFQNIKHLYFAGNCIDSRFDTSIENYLGEWPKEFLYKNLTNYSNLVLLSDGEADPLVTKEALTAGLGLVVSEYASANLDLSLPFITVIPNDKINDLTYIEKAIIENRLISNNNREKIRSYALQNHTWDIIIDKYINIIYNILNDSNKN